MTAIVGWIDKETGKTWVGADSAGSDSETSFIRQDTKVFKNGPFLIAGAGSFRCIQLLRFDTPGCKDKLSQLKPPRRKADLYKFMVTKFVPCLRSIFYANGYSRHDANEETFDASFIVAFRGKLFGIEGDYQVGEYDDFVAMGSGYHLCLGSLRVCWDHDFGAEESIIEALESAERFGRGIKKPFIILNN